jgi:hypothetical protein
MTITSAKSAFDAFCSENGIEVLHERKRKHHHVRIVAPVGKIFSGTRLQDLCVADTDDGPPVWSDCLRQVRSEMPLEDNADEDRGSVSQVPGDEHAA